MNAPVTADWIAVDWGTSTINGPTTVVACGMVGARQGWKEAPYVCVPCPTLPNGFTHAPTQDANLLVHIIPGISQTKPADVMRGEETQITGFLARNPNWDGVICLPGTHTKWVHVSADEIVAGMMRRLLTPFLKPCRARNGLPRICLHCGPRTCCKTCRMQRRGRGSLAC